MPKEVENIEVDEEVIEEEVAEKEVTPTEPKKSPTQYRVERAERQTEQKILEDLGVESLEDIKTRLARVEEFEAKITKMEIDRERNAKKELLIKELDKENAFDSEILAHVVDLDKLESNPESIQAVVQQIKETKPKHFGVESLKGDEVKTGKQIDSNPIKEHESRGDYHAAIAEWLKQ